MRPPHYSAIRRVLPSFCALTLTLFGPIRLPYASVQKESGAAAKGLAILGADPILCRIMKFKSGIIAAK